MVAAPAAAEQALFCKPTLEWTKYKSDHYFSLENEPSEVVSTFQVSNQIKAVHPLFHFRYVNSTILNYYFSLNIKYAGKENERRA